MMAIRVLMAWAIVLLAQPGSGVNNFRARLREIGTSRRRE
jgi:hypothetical protein